MKKVTWNDMHEATQTELKSTYKLNDRQLEQHIRKHLYGSNAVERRAEYQQLYGKRK